MHTDARTLDNGTLIEGDICIVGAGAAGISMALEWKDTPYKVILLEGGGFDLEAEMQALYRAENIGRHYYALEAARWHVFGGTTGHWGGFCSPYDPIDFKKRDWVPHSGWPIERKDLDPYYARAQQVVGIGPPEYWNADHWAQQDPRRAQLPFDQERVWTKMWQFCTTQPEARFGSYYRDAIVGAENIHLYTYGNVCNIEANEPVSQVEGLQVRCLNGKEHQVRARYYVLACGAIQNARLLLSSNSQASAGLGNDHDLVGRFFMEHLEVHVAYLLLPASAPLKLYGLNLFEVLEHLDRSRGELALSESLQREHRLLNGTAVLSPVPESEKLTSMFDTWQEYDAGAKFLDRFYKAYAAYQQGEGKQIDPTQLKEVRLRTRSEPAPNPDSRILLSEEKDALGVPRVKLNWQLTEFDKRSMRKTYEVLGQEAGRSGVGRVRLRDWLQEEDDTMWPDYLSGGWHHMGTARMHDNPQEGVVDANCKIHGLGNLYVAGSAAFTTAGAANPTLTLIALSLRLSDHLKEKMA